MELRLNVCAGNRNFFLQYAGEMHIIELRRQAIKLRRKSEMENTKPIVSIILGLLEPYKYIHMHDFNQSAIEISSGFAPSY